MKPRIFHSQRECQIRQRYSLPITDDVGAHLSFRNTRVGEVVARECYLCIRLRLRKEAGLAGEGHCTGCRRKRGGNAVPSP